MGASSAAAAAIAAMGLLRRKYICVAPDKRDHGCVLLLSHGGLDAPPDDNRRRGTADAAAGECRNCAVYKTTIPQQRESLHFGWCKSALEGSAMSSFSTRAEPAGSEK